MEARKVIVKELAKDNRLEAVADQDDCEFMINYGSGWMTTGASVLGSTVTANSRDIGEFVVTTRGKPDHAAKVVRQRIVWSTKKQQSYAAGITLNPHPAINATREFLKDLEKARRAQANVPPKQDISPPSSGSTFSLSAGSDVSPKTATSRPTILYKERAKYTNEARAHRIEGTVTLRVEYLANGRIGRVEVIRGLPHGLSESAIEAAKRVRFNPAVKDGVPVSVQGTIDFTFTL